MMARNPQNAPKECQIVPNEPQDPRECPKDSNSGARTLPCSVELHLRVPVRPVCAYVSMLFLFAATLPRLCQADSFRGRTAQALPGSSSGSARHRREGRVAQALPGIAAKEELHLE